MDAVFCRREHTSETDSPLRLRSSVAGAKGYLYPAREGCDDVSYNGRPMFEAGALALLLTLVPQNDGDGHIALQDERYREALEIFDALLASQPENASGHHGRGLALSALADDRGAVLAFEKAVALAPTAVAARYDYARSLEALDELARALVAYRAVLELNSNHRGARYRLGTLLLRAGRAEDAERFLRGYEPFRLWDHQVRLLEAMLASDKLTPTDGQQKTLALLRLFLDGGEIDQARRVLDRSLTDFQEEASFEVPRARWFMLSGRVTEARRALDLVMSNSSTASANRDAVWLSTKLNVREQRKVEALADYKTLLRLWPDPPARVHHEIGTTYAVNGRLEEAIIHFKKALPAEPRLAQVHADLGLALVSLGRSASAEAHYREALETKPSRIPAQQGLGSLLLDRGEALTAIELFRDSVALRSGDPILRKNLALAFHHAGRFEEAEAELQKARELEH